MSCLGIVDPTGEGQCANDFKWPEHGGITQNADDTRPPLLKQHNKFVFKKATMFASGSAFSVHSPSSVNNLTESHASLTAWNTNQSKKFI